MNNMNRTLAATILILLAGLVLLAATDRTTELVKVRAERYIMGTIFSITAYGEERGVTLATINRAYAAIRDVDAVMSHYRSESDLMRLNHLGANGPVEVPESLYRILKESVHYAQVSNGAFDVTVGPLVHLWDDREEQGRVPSVDEVSTLVFPGIGQPFRLLPGSRKVEFSRPNVEVTLGAIGKGWAIDRAVEILREGGIRHALLSAGTSTLYAMGDSGGEPRERRGWPVDLLNPCDTGRTIWRIRLRDESLSTSAAYEQYWEIDGRRYSHILDPRTGYPVEPLRSVSVIAPSATATDALSTAVYVLGLEEGSRLLRSQGAKGFLVSSAGSDDSRNSNVASKTDVCRIHIVPSGGDSLMTDREDN